MTTYKVTDSNGFEVKPGDEIFSFREEAAEFIAVERGPEFNGTAKVRVKWIINQFTQTLYDRVFDLTVTPED